MTIGAWIFFATIAIILIIIGSLAGISLGDKCPVRGIAIGILVGAVVSILILVGMLWYYGNTETGKRAMKSQESNLDGGIERTVTIYDIKGDVISEYEGKFDVDYNDSRIIFDDENGKRHIIYYKTATVIIDEK